MREIRVSLSSRRQKMFPLSSSSLRGLRRLAWPLLFAVFWRTNPAHAQVADIDKVMRDEAKIQKAHANNTVSSHKGELPRWGEAGYWTKLKLITVTGAELTPYFDPDVYNYDVEIRNARDRLVHIIPELDFRHFPPRYPPKIELDGVEHKYSSLEPVLIPFWANMSNAALDYTALLVISDPENAYADSTYYLRMLQAPAPDLLRLTSLHVYNNFGVEVEQGEETRHLHNKFTYVLSSLHDYVDIYAECDPDTPYYKFDGEVYWPGQSYRQYMRHPQEHVLVACVYKSLRWTGGSEQSRTYLVKLEKPEPTDLETVEFSLQTPAALGSCKKKEGGDFVCRSFTNKVTLIALWNSTNEIKMLDAEDHQTKLLNGMPTVLSQPNGVEEFTILMRGAHGARREIPLEIQTDTRSSHAKWFGANLMRIDMSKLVVVNPIMGEGHCVHDPKDRSKIYCVTHLRQVHLMVVYGQPDGITAEFRRPTEEKLCDVQLGLPTEAISVASGKTGTKLVLRVYKNGDPFHHYTVYLHTTLRKHQLVDNTQSVGHFLPTEKAEENKEGEKEREKERLKAIQASSVMGTLPAEVGGERRLDRAASAVKVEVEEDERMRSRKRPPGDADVLAARDKSTQARTRAEAEAEAVTTMLDMARERGRVLEEELAQTFGWERRRNDVGHVNQVQETQAEVFQ